MTYLSITLLCISSIFFSSIEPAPLKVMSYNIRYGTANDGENHWNKRKSFLLDTIRTINPDLLGTQETLAFQRDYLEKELAGYASFGVGRDDGKLKGEMAALFYRNDRFEKLDGGHFWLSTTPEKVGSKGWDAALPRIATWVRLKDKLATNAKPLLFMNTHFDHQGKQARRQAAGLIRQKLEELGKDCDVVITGDFNAGEASDPYTSLFANQDGKKSIVFDTYRTLHPVRAKDEGTFNGFKTDSRQGDRIDWIGCSRAFYVRDAVIDHTVKDGKVPSDHFAVHTTLERTAK